MKRALLIIFVASTSAGCHDKATSSGCSNHDDCDPGEVCVDQVCAAICVTDDDCGAGKICVDEVCKDGVRADVPVISVVDGSGTANATTTHPDGTMTAHRLRDRIIVTGEHLAGASATLVSRDGSNIPLTVVSATDAELVALVPETLTEGLYSLRVEKRAGADQVDTWVLKGEEGPPPSEAAIQAAVSAMTDLDVAALGGRPAAGYHDTLTWGRFFEAEIAPVVVGDPSIEVVSDSTASAGSRLLAEYGDQPGALATLSSTDVGELLAPFPVMAELRLKVLGNASASDVVTISCSATRAGDSSSTVLGSAVLKPNMFAAADTWQAFPLYCDFRPDDVNQTVAVDPYVDQVTELSFDYLRLSVAGEGGPSVQTFVVEGTTDVCSTASTTYTMIPDMNLDVQLMRPATLLVTFQMTSVPAEANNWIAFRMVVDGVPDPRATHMQDGAGLDKHVTMTRVVTVAPGQRNVHVEWGEGAGSVCNNAGNTGHSEPGTATIWMRRLTVVALLH